MLTDERYKQLMEDVGMPNSRSLLQALKQAVMEATLAEREACAKAMAQQEPRGQNRYGLDMSYMVGKLNIMIRDIDNYKCDEAARTLLRLAMVADESVFSEAEFVLPAPAAAIPEAMSHISDSGGYFDDCYINGWNACREAMLSASPKP